MAHHTLTSPFSEQAIRALRIRDTVTIDGHIYGIRDATQIRIFDEQQEPPVDLNGAVLYHCGPVMLKDGERWTVKAAGPTTSIREEPYEHEVIKRYGVRAVIGKGGMGPKTLAAMGEHGAVYLNAIGGAAQYYARTVKSVKDVHLLEEMGIPEAMWHYDVKDFVAIVTMDSHGNSLHADVLKSTGEALAALQEG